MKRILFLLLLISGTAYGQSQPTSSKTRFVNGLYMGTKLDSYFNAADSNAIYWRADSVVMAKYKGTARALAFDVAGGYVPYTGATQNVNLGNFRLTGRSVSTDSIYARSSAGGRIVTNSGSTIAEYGLGSGANFDFHGFAGYNANRASSYTARSFTDKNYVDSADALRLRISDTSAMLAPFIQYSDTSGLYSQVVRTFGVQTIGGDKTLTGVLSGTSANFSGNISISSGAQVSLSAASPNFTRLYRSGGLVLENNTYQITLSDAGVTTLPSSLSGTSAAFSSYGLFGGATNNGVDILRATGSGSFSKSLYSGGFNGGHALSMGATGGDYGSVGYNVLFGSANDTYIVSDFASRVRFQSGGFQFQTAASGTSGNSISWATPLTISRSGDLTAASISKTGSGVSEFLMGDGSVLSKNNFYIGDATFDTATRALTIPKAGGGSTSVVIPRGSASGTSGITALSSSRTGNLVTVSGDNGSSTIFSVSDADSSSAFLFSDTASLVAPYLRKSDTATMLSTRAYKDLTNVNGVLSSTYGGAGSVNGILKANGSGVVSAAVNNTDFTLLNGTGFVKASGTSITYDNSTYLTTSSAASTYLPLTGGNVTGSTNLATVSGSVGIGTSSPTVRLDVSGDIAVGSGNYVSFASNNLNISKIYRSGGIRFEANTFLSTYSDAGNWLIDTTFDNLVDRLQVNGTVLGSGFKVPSGTSSQFLKANGSVDNNTYSTTSATALKLNISDTSGMLGNYRRTTTKITNSDLANSTISGVALGGSLSNLTTGYGLSGTAYNGGTAQTWNVDTSTISTKANVTGSLLGYVNNSSTQTVGGAKTFTSAVKSAGLIQPISLKSANYTLTATDHTVIFNATAANRTATLPAGVEGQIYVIRIVANDNTKSVTVTPNGSETIESGSLYVIYSSTCGDPSYTFQFLSGNWYIISSHIPPCL
jgi:hypothetical protein